MGAATKAVATHHLPSPPDMKTRPRMCAAPSPQLWGGPCSLELQGKREQTCLMPEARWRGHKHKDLEFKENAACWSVAGGTSDGAGWGQGIGFWEKRWQGWVVPTSPSGGPCRRLKVKVAQCVQLSWGPMDHTGMEPPGQNIEWVQPFPSPGRLPQPRDGTLWSP